MIRIISVSNEEQVLESKGKQTRAQNEYLHNDHIKLLGHLRQNQASMPHTEMRTNLTSTAKMQ